MKAWHAAAALASLVIADQAAKLWIDLYEPSIGLGLVLLHKVTNTGASFGMLQGNNTLLIFVSLMVLGFIMMSIRQITGNQQLPIVLITAGLLGNLFDRITRGHVIDFIDVRWFPVFNFADSYITIGGALLAFFLIAGSDKPGKSQGLRKKKGSIR